DKCKRIFKDITKTVIETLAKVLDVLAKICNIASVVLTVAAVICLIVPGLEEFAPVLFAASTIVGMIGSAATLGRFGLALAAYGLGKAWHMDIKVKRPSVVDGVFAVIGLIPGISAIKQAGGLKALTSMEGLKVLGGLKGTVVDTLSDE